MQSTLSKKLWAYPIIFGLLGALTGLLIRYLFANPIYAFPFKNILHSHSHIMLLGFVFNALIVLLWTNYTKEIDKVSYKYYIALQICMLAMFVAFILQGYALFSILFSTLHLWISYILLIRLWKRLQGQKAVVNLIKVGIVFHFISSIGPYCLGPLMVFEMKESPWYQQAIFFYLHFQYFGSLFLWFLAVFLHKASIQFNKKHVLLICISLIGLYTHSLDYSFNHFLIQLIGGLSSLALFFVLLSFAKQLKYQKRAYQYIYVILIIIAICNILGSFSNIAILVETDRYFLIAWLHFLFLGLFVPFIWVELSFSINYKLWVFYSLMVLTSELLLVFHNQTYSLFNISIMWLLLIPYIGITMCFCVIHSGYFIQKKNVLG